MGLDAEKMREKLLDTMIPVKFILPPWALELENDTLAPIIKNYAIIGRLDTITKKELLKVRGIGEKKADEIIERRNNHKERND